METESSAPAASAVTDIELRPDEPAAQSNAHKPGLTEHLTPTVVEATGVVENSPGSAQPATLHAEAQQSEDKDQGHIQQGGLPAASDGVDRTNVVAEADQTPAASDGVDRTNVVAEAAQAPSSAQPATLHAEAQQSEGKDQGHIQQQGGLSEASDGVDRTNVVAEADQAITAVSEAAVDGVIAAHNTIAFDASVLEGSATAEQESPSNVVSGLMNSQPDLTFADQIMPLDEHVSSADQHAGASEHTGYVPEIASTSGNHEGTDHVVVINNSPDTIPQSRDNSTEIETVPPPEAAHEGLGSAVVDIEAASGEDYVMQSGPQQEGESVEPAVDPRVQEGENVEPVVDPRVQAATSLPGSVFLQTESVPESEDCELKSAAQLEPQSAASRIFQTLGSIGRAASTGKSGLFASLRSKSERKDLAPPQPQTPYEELKSVVLAIFGALNAESEQEKKEGFLTLFHTIGGEIKKAKPSKKRTINVSGDLGEMLIRLGIAVEAQHLQQIIHKVCRARGREPDSWYGAGVSLKTPVYNELDANEFVDVMKLLTSNEQKSDSNKIVQARAMFSAFDKNGDRAIDADEFKAMVSHHGLQLSAERCDELLEAVAGPNKVIDFATFMEFLGVKGKNEDYGASVKESARQKLRETLITFHMFDADAGGTIDISELSSILRAMGQRLSPEELVKMVDVADEHGTGEIDFENFCRHILQISDEEFAEMLEAHLESPVTLEHTIGSKKRKTIEELAHRAWKRTLQQKQHKAEGRGSFKDSGAAHSTAFMWEDYGQHANLSLQHPQVAKIIAEGESVDQKVPLVVKKMLGRPMTITACHEHGTVTCAAFSPDGRLVALTCQDGMLRLIDVARPKPKQVCSVVAHDHAALSLAWSADGKDIFTGGADRIVARWAVEDLSVMASRVHHSAYVRCVTSSPNGQWVSSCSSDMTVVVMDAKTLNPVTEKPLLGHTSWVRWCRFTHDNKRLITGSDDQTVMVWEVPTGNALQTLRAHLHSVACGAAIPNNKLFTGGYDENVLLWTQDTGLLGYLKVFVVEAFHLKRGDTLTTNMSNQRFVTIELGKGQREQTNTKKGSSPHWFEEFNMSVWNLDENVLVQVWDWDKDASHRLLGELMVPLEDLVYAEEGVTDREFDLADEEGNPSPASISLRFTFREVECIGEVTVSIEKARNLPRMDTFGLSDPFCAVSVGKSERHKTKVVRRSLNPVWNEEFVYNVEEGAREVKMVLYDWSVTKEEDFIGQVNIPISSLVETPFRDDWFKLKSIDGQAEVKGELKVKIKFLSEAERDKGVVRFRRNPHTWPAAAKEDCQYYSPVGQLQFYGRVLMRGRCKHCSKHRHQHTNNLRCDLGIGNYVHCVDVSSCATYVAWGTGDGRIRIAIIATAEQISCWTAHAGPVHGLAFASGDQRLVSWGPDYRTADMSDFFHGSFFPRNEAKQRKGRDWTVEVWYVGSMIKAVFAKTKRKMPASPVGTEHSDVTLSEDGSEAKEGEEEEDEEEEDDEEEDDDDATKSEAASGQGGDSPLAKDAGKDEQAESKAAKKGKEAGRLGRGRVLPGAKVGYTPVYYEPPVLPNGTVVRSCLKGRGRKEVLSVPGLRWNEADPERFSYPPEQPDGGGEEEEEEEEEEAAERERRALQRKKERKQKRLAREQSESLESQHSLLGTVPVV